MSSSPRLYARARPLLSWGFNGAAQLLQEIDKAALVCPHRYRGARAIRARPAARFSQFRLKMGENRAAVSVAVFSRFAIYANVVSPTHGKRLSNEAAIGIMPCRCYAAVFFSLEMKTTFPALRDRLAQLLQRLEAAGIVVHPSSRFGRYSKELEIAARSEYDMPPDDVLRVWHRLLIEVDDLDTIVSALSVEPVVRGWEEKTQATLSGGLLRTQDQNDCAARNIQFELLVASILRRAGYSIRLGDALNGEPDVLCTSSASRFAVEAKRPRSPAKVKRNIRTAQHQMAQHCLSGLVAVDLTILENPSDKHFTTRTFAQAHEALVQRFLLMSGYVRWAETGGIDTSVVFGLITHVALPLWEPDERTMSFMQRWSILSLVEETDARHNTLIEVHDKLTYLGAG